MWVRKQWEKQAEIAKSILDEKGDRINRKEKAELEDIIRYVEELKRHPAPVVAVDYIERRR